jgi:transcription initiation factor TFIIB
MLDAEEDHAATWGLFGMFASDIDRRRGRRGEDDANGGCAHERTLLDEGHYVCLDCKVITGRHIDTGAEWRFYACEDGKNSDPSRCGMPVNDLLPNASLGSCISHQNNESMYMKIVKQHAGFLSMTYRERSMLAIFDHIGNVASSNNIPAVIIEQAKNYYKAVADKKISRGDNRSGLIAAAVYMACKCSKVPRSAREVAKFFNIDLPTMTKGCKDIQMIMNFDFECTSASDFVQRFSSKLNVPDDLAKLCKSIIDRAEELQIVGENTPPSVAAAALYLSVTVCNAGIQKAELSRACDISQVTLTKCYKKLHTHRAHLFSNDEIMRYAIV